MVVLNYIHKLDVPMKNKVYNCQDNNKITIFFTIRVVVIMIRPNPIIIINYL